MAHATGKYVAGRHNNSTAQHSTAANMQHQLSLLYCQLIPEHPRNIPGGKMWGGYSIHFLEPVTTAFQAEVALGSLWNVEPERGGPMISHR